MNLFSLGRVFFTSYRSFSLARPSKISLPSSPPSSTSAPPALAPGCAPDSLDRATPIRITGLASGVTLRRAPNSDQPLRVTLRALGAEGEVQWLLDGRLQGSSVGAAVQSLVLHRPGPHTVTALTRDGAFSAVRFRVAD